GGRGRCARHGAAASHLSVGRAGDEHERQRDERRSSGKGFHDEPALLPPPALTLTPGLRGYNGACLIRNSSLNPCAASSRRSASRSCALLNKSMRRSPPAPAR